MKSFEATLAGPLKEVKFDAVYIAENIGNYKPSHKNFEYLLEHVKESFGVEKGEVLMTAHGLKSDHVPAKEMGMSSCWIARGDGDGTIESEGKGGSDGKVKDVEGRVAFTWVFDTMGEFFHAGLISRSFGGLLGYKACAGCSRGSESSKTCALNGCSPYLRGRKTAR